MVEIKKYRSVHNKNGEIIYDVSEFEGHYVVINTKDFDRIEVVRA